MPHKLLFLIALIPFLLLASCVKEEQFITDSSARLAFSSDTVSFDTVFTAMTTTTEYVKVYNHYDEPLLINTVSLQGQYANRFRLNVDGDTNRVARNVEIGAHDSIFIFVQANINPNDQTNPFLIDADIVFNFNNKQQNLPIVAYGRNAIYHLPTYTHHIYQLYVNRGGQIDTMWIPFSIIDCSSWDHTRPHVVLGYAVVNSNETLHLNAGEELYFGNDACLWIYDSASLIVQGTQQQPVIFTSLRHDGYYDTLPGQWSHIWLSQGSKDNNIEWARIENGTYGILVDTNVTNNPTLDIKNSIIRNQSMIGIRGQGAYIVGDNLLIYNCGTALLDLHFGGRYIFSNSTFANYWRYSSRKTPSVIINNYYAFNETTIFPRPIREATFRNCIIYGNYGGTNNSGEVKLDRLEGYEFNYTFSHCLVRSSIIENADGTVILNQDPLFTDPKTNNYIPSSESPAIGAGNAAYLLYPTDLLGTPRNSPPTIGALEPTN